MVSAAVSAAAAAAAFVVVPKVAAGACCRGGDEDCLKNWHVSMKKGSRILEIWSIDTAGAHLLASALSWVAAGGVVVGERLPLLSRAEECLGGGGGGGGMFLLMVRVEFDLGDDRLQMHIVEVKRQEHQ